MALLHKLFLFMSLLLPCLLLPMTIVARPVPYEQNLAARLQSDGMMQCWDSLLELRACTGEVILFFLNGETYLGPNCCRAIGVIEHKCWPDMLTSVGFTVAEGDILRGYCDASASPGPTSEHRSTDGFIVAEELVH